MSDQGRVLYGFIEQLWSALDFLESVGHRMRLDKLAMSRKMYRHAWSWVSSCSFKWSLRSSVRNVDAAD